MINTPHIQNKPISSSSELSIYKIQHEINLKNSEIASLERARQINTTNYIQPNVQTITEYHCQKWYTTVFLRIKEFSAKVLTLVDSEADINGNREGLVPTK